MVSGFQGGGQSLLMGNGKVLIGVLANEAVESVALICVGASAGKQSLWLSAFERVEFGWPERVGGFGHRQLAILRPHGVLGVGGAGAEVRKNRE